MAFLGIKENLKKQALTSRYNIAIVHCLLKSLENHLGHDPLYCVAAALDPSFKLNWCKSEDQKDEVLTMLKSEMSLHHSNEVQSVSDEPATSKTIEPPTKKMKLFSFMDDDASTSEQSKPDSNR